MLINIRTPDWLHLKFLFFKDHLRKPSNIDSKKHVVSGGHGSMGQYWPCWTAVKTCWNNVRRGLCLGSSPESPGPIPKWYGFGNRLPQDPMVYHPFSIHFHQFSRLELSFYGYIYTTCSDPSIHHDDPHDDPKTQSFLHLAQRTTLAIVVKHLPGVLQALGTLPKVRFIAGNIIHGGFCKPRLILCKA